jgi:hypothetical protein
MATPKSLDILLITIIAHPDTIAGIRRDWDGNRGTPNRIEINGNQALDAHGRWQPVCVKLCPQLVER